MGSLIKTGALGLIAASMAIGACQPSASDFYARTYSCDGTKTTNSCGTGASGRPLACFPATQLGATDFCAETCDPAMPAVGDAALCLGSGIQLKTCHPSQQSSTDATARECGDQLSCYRTDLASDEGVCMTGHTCVSDADCASPDRSTCASTLLKAIYSDPSSLALDHLNCVKTDCARNNSNCPDGEYCVPSRVPPQSGPADLCLPLCGPPPALNCPPNYVCFRLISGPAAPPICIPGLLGTKCRTDTDCMIGSCIDTDTAFKVCSVPCGSDADCIGYNGTKDTFVCATPKAGAGPHCMTSSSFGGAPCATDADCLVDGSHCTLYSPYGPITPNQGLCLVPCDTAGQCPARGGIPHACFDFLSPPVCYPGRTGIDCHSDADCIGDLRCLSSPQLGPDDQITQRLTCTLPCATDLDCASNPFGYADNTWCEGGVCVLSRSGDYLCQRDLECASLMCVPSTRPGEAGSGVTRCTAFPISPF